MLRLSLSAALILLSLTQPALAAGQTKTKKTPSGDVVGETDGGKPIVRHSEVVLHDSSEAMRQGKKGSVVAEIGSAVGGIPTSGLAGGYYLDSNSIVEGSYVSGSTDILFLKVKATLVEARYKKFWGNSFYTNLGVGYRTIEIGASLAPLTGSKDIDSSLSVSSIGASVGIGNRWQWESFTIGCDWIGTFIPLTTTGETKVNEPSADASDIKRTEKEAEDLGKASSGQILRFYLGVSF